MSRKKAQRSPPCFSNHSFPKKSCGYRTPKSLISPMSSSSFPQLCTCIVFAEDVATGGSNLASLAHLPFFFPLLLRLRLPANMPPTRFDNYIRMFRKQAGLSQDELAFLLGWKSGSGISRFERGRREPTLEVLLAMEAVFGVPIRELYAGRFQKVERSVKERAGHFISDIGESLPKRKRLRSFLSAIYSEETYPPHGNNF